LIIKEVRPPQPPPPPPLIIRQRAPALPQPPPLVLREKPPAIPASVGTQTGPFLFIFLQKQIASFFPVIRKLPAVPVPPRSVIIERLPPLPPKPRTITFLSRSLETAYCFQVILSSNDGCLILL